MIIFSVEYDETKQSGRGALQSLPVARLDISPDPLTLCTARCLPVSSVVHPRVIELPARPLMLMNRCIVARREEMSARE